MGTALTAGGCFGFEEPSLIENSSVSGGAAGNAGSTSGSGGTSTPATGGTRSAGGTSGTGGTGGATGGAGANAGGSDAGMGGESATSGSGGTGGDGGTGGSGGDAGAASGGESGAGGASCGPCAPVENGTTSCADDVCSVTCNDTFLRCDDGISVSCHRSRWDFESNTLEGWSKDTINTNADAGTPFVAGVAHTGSKSLGHALMTTATGTSASVNAPVCGNPGVALDLRGKTLTAWYYLSGPALNPDSIVRFCAQLFNRVKAVHCEFVLNPELDTWVPVSLPLDDPEDDSLSGISFSFSPGGSGGWDGVYYLDDVSIE